MGRLVGRQVNTKKYSESHVKSVLLAIGIRISSETSHDFLCFCPIHNNRHTPSLSVSKTKDSFICFNADCAASGTLVDLVQQVSGRNYFEAARFLLMTQPTEQASFEEELGSVLLDAPEYKEFSTDVLDRMWEDMRQPASAGRSYMHGRGFTDDTIDYFKVGYSAKKNMVAVPVHSPTGIPVGVVGRSIEGKSFKNSVGLPTSKTFFNIHRAKRIGSSVIVVEASFDAMSVHQAGYPNVIANLGGHLSPYKVSLLDKFFDRIVLFTDDDESGRKLGEKIASSLHSRKDILWSNYRPSQRYPFGYKDANSILQEPGGEDRIRQCIENAIPNWEFVSSMV